MKWGETHHFRFNPHVTVNVPFRQPIPLGALGIDFSSGLLVWQFLGSKMFQGYRGLRFFRYFGSPTKTRKNTPLKQQDSAGRYIFGCLGNCGMLHLTDLHFLSLECAPQEVGPIQTRRGCLVLFLRKILVGLKALTKNMASESEMT